LEPDKRAAWASGPGSSRASSGRNRKRPPQQVKNLRGAKEKVRGIAHRFHRGLRSLGPFLIQAARQRGKALGFEQLAHGGGTQGELAFFQGLTDFVNGVVLFAQRDDQGAGGGLFGLRTGAGAASDKETGLRVAEKSVAEDAERAGGIAEGAGGFLGGASLSVISAERLILALSGVARFAGKRRWIC
jgi:hypothetical protein